MKNLLIVTLFIMLITQLACSMGSRHIRDNTYVRSMDKTFFWPSKDKGVWITQTCVKRTKKKKCKEWKKRTLSSETDWQFIRDTKYIMVQENMLLGDL